MRRRPTARVAALVVSAAAVIVSLAPAGPSAQAATAAGRCGDVKTRPWCDTHKSPDQRAALLQAAMTQDEEIMLLGGNTAGQAPHTGASYAIDRLGIPAVFFSDGPVGPRQGSATAMPIPLALAASFDPALADAHGAEIADEAKAKGNDVVFAPTVNILRNPQGGRSYEAYGEEPYLVGQTAVSWINGAQRHGVVADVKHFAANNQEGQIGAPPISGLNGSRSLINVVVDERTLREVYLPHFEAAVKQAHVGTIMCSYNQINGAYACENTHTLQQVLEREWGFRGIVLSDYGAAHNTANNLNNGLDFEPSGPALAKNSYNPQQIQVALATGQVTKTTLDLHVRRILRTFFAYGLFDRPGYRNDDAQINKAADNAVAQRIEEQAITLLQNRGALLPLSTHKLRSIAVIGPYADRFVTGGGSGTVTPFAATTVLAGIRKRVGSGVSVTYDDGSNATSAAAAAKAADVAVVVVGDVESEGGDKDCISLNCNSDTASSEALLLLQGSSCGVQTCPVNGLQEDALVSAVAAANRRTVVVMQTGAPVLTPWVEEVPALLESWYPGQAGGTAIARVLFGDVDPGGRLPATFPASADQLPTAGDMESYPGVAQTETYKEKLLVGYRWYDAHHLTPAFPFGAGLSYTRFHYSNLQVKAGHAGSQAVSTATLDVTNTGARTGTAVPQLYMSKPSSAALPQPVRQLVGYGKVSLQPGRTARITFPLNDRSFASWNTAANRWVIAPGCYGLAGGASSRDLPTHAVIGRGARCSPGSPQLTTAGTFTLPLPAHPTVQVLAAGSGQTRQSANPIVAQLPRTGPSGGIPAGAVLLLGFGLLVRWLRRSRATA
ncbi:MAG: glycosyl hydrolase [Frankiales bacterium]|nr:glycosyl hydrolase [Frankiales bacterium]